MPPQSAIQREAILLQNTPAGDIADEDGGVHPNNVQILETKVADKSYSIGHVALIPKWDTQPVADVCLLRMPWKTDAYTTYYFRAQAVGDGTSYGAEISFTTGLVLPGDANNDGEINTLDITSVERIIAGLDATTSGADANQDGYTNAMDITKTERLIAGLD